mgnify:FL=1
MLSSNHAYRHKEHQPAEAASSTTELAVNMDEVEINGASATSQRWETSCADADDHMEHPSKFIKGVTIALPASITLWAGLLLGLKAIF